MSPPFTPQRPHQNPNSSNSSPYTDEFIQARYDEYLKQISPPQHHPNPPRQNALPHPTHASPSRGEHPQPNSHSSRYHPYTLPQNRPLQPPSIGYGEDSSAMHRRREPMPQSVMPSSGVAWNNVQRGGSSFGVSPSVNRIDGPFISSAASRDLELQASPSGYSNGSAVPRQLSNMPGPSQPRFPPSTATYPPPPMQLPFDPRSRQFDSPPHQPPESYQSNFFDGLSRSYNPSPFQPCPSPQHSPIASCSTTSQPPGNRVAPIGSLSPKSHDPPSSPLSHSVTRQSSFATRESPSSVDAALKMTVATDILTQENITTPPAPTFEIKSDLKVEVGAIWPSRGQLMVASHQQQLAKGFGWHLLIKYGRKKGGWVLGCSTTQGNKTLHSLCPGRMSIEPLETKDYQGKWRILNIVDHNHGPDPHERLMDWTDEQDFLDEFLLARGDRERQRRADRKEEMELDRTESSSSGSRTPSPDPHFVSDFTMESPELDLDQSKWKPRSELVMTSYREQSAAGFGWRILSKSQNESGWTLGCSTTAVNGLSTATCPARLDIRPQDFKSDAKLWEIKRYEPKHNHDPNPDETLNNWRNEKDLSTEFRTLRRFKRNGVETVAPWRRSSSEKKKLERLPISNAPPSTSSHYRENERFLIPIPSSSPPLSIDDLEAFFASLNPLLVDFATPLHDIGLTNYESLLGFMEDPLTVLDGEEIGTFFLRRVLASELGKATGKLESET